MIQPSDAPCDTCQGWGEFGLLAESLPGRYPRDQYRRCPDCGGSGINIASYLHKHRPTLSELRALDIDRDGRDILVGLTYAETVHYIGLNESLRGRTVEEDEEWGVLYNKHERTRLDVLMAENEARHTPGRQ